MSMNANSWNENLMGDWAETQRKYWETWGEFAKNVGGFGANGQTSTNPYAAFSNFASNPFSTAAFAQNPFAQNPFTQNPFTQNPFTQNPFAQTPFVQNPFAQSSAFTTNPFTAFTQSNPFRDGMEQWWKSLGPQVNGEIGTVAQRFYDMGKSFMSLAEGSFGASTQEQPDAAMQVWMSSMQAALQNWITQIQNNIDMVTPDLPGVSGTTLSTWAQLADSVAPWLNMSQSYLKDVAEGHLPGGIEMPGVGAAQEQFLRALSMPGLGFTREQQERMQQLARDLLNYHEALRAYKLAFAKTALASLDAVQKRLQAMHEEGKAIDSLRSLYDMWVDASEDAYGDFAMSDEYQVVYGDLVNALMRVRKNINQLAEQHYRLMNIPTRSEIDTMQHRQMDVRRENRALRRELTELRNTVEKLAQSTRASTGKRSAPAQDSSPISDVVEDLTAIKGIGPKMAEKLYEQGIKNFAQIASMNMSFAEQLDETLKAQGRILREDWIGQAKKLLG